MSTMGSKLFLIACTQIVGSMGELDTGWGKIARNHYCFNKQETFATLYMVSLCPSFEYGNPKCSQSQFGNEHLLCLLQKVFEHFRPLKGYFLLPKYPASSHEVTSSTMT